MRVYSTVNHLTMGDLGREALCALFPVITRPQLYRFPSCPKQQSHPKLPHASKHSSRLLSSPTKSRPRQTFSLIHLDPSCNRATPRPLSLLSFKTNFKSWTNLAVVTKG